MKFPAYWAKATAEETTPAGRNYAVKRWRWSDTSPEQAHESALAAAKQALGKLMSSGELPDEYGGYERGPVREEVKQRFTGEDGQLIAAVTQNRYGTLVLNTSRVMFVDVDFPEIPAGQQIGHFFKTLFGKRPPSPQQQAEEQTRGELAAFVTDNRPWAARVYRTHSGFRVLATHALFEPAADSTLAVFRALKADPLYVRMCRGQQCFRARLTPKPWRCGHQANRIEWPRETGEAQRDFDAWHSEYLARQAGFATCRFVETLGEDRVHPEAQQIIDVHDQVTRSRQPLELA